MKNKSESRNLLNNFVTYVKTLFGKCIKIVRTDNGSEFNCRDFYDNLGTVHQTSCVETP